MKSLWKWLGVAACGVGLLVAADRFSVVTASEDQPAYERSGDTADKLDRLAEKLDRLLNRMEGRMGPGGPPRGDHGGPPPGGAHHERPHHERPERSGSPQRPQRELPPEVRERMQQAREEMKERMEKAREKFRELEERVKSLEAEVEQLKAARAG